MSSTPGSIREIIFGLEDSLVSTLGAVTGIAAGTQNSYIVILSGLVLVAVESVSMAAGSYLSSEAAEDRQPLSKAGVMFLSYVIGGVIPIIPYLVLPLRLAYAPSIILTVASLFCVGAWRGTVTHRSVWRSAFEMVSVSFAAAFVGFLIGRLISQWTGVSL